MKEMIVPIHLFMLVLSLVFFVLNGLGVPETPKLHYLGWGLFFFTLSWMVFVGA